MNSAWELDIKKAVYKHFQSLCTLPFHVEGQQLKNNCVEVRLTDFIYNQITKNEFEVFFTIGALITLTENTNNIYRLSQLTAQVTPAFTVGIPFSNGCIRLVSDIKITQLGKKQSAVDMEQSFIYADYKIDLMED